MRDKRGAVEGYFLATTILAIIGFMVVLYFLLNLDLIGQTEDEICKLSVLTRASPDIAKSGVPLKCNTKKVCLTRDGDCSENFAGENPEIVKLDRDDGKAIKQIEKISADVMLDCWKMMGEGKLDLFGSFSGSLGLNPEVPTCVICSRIAIDKGFPKENLDSININEYMRQNVIPELGVNYLSALTGGGIVSYAKSDPVKDNAFKEFAEKNKVLDLTENKENRELAIVFSQIKSKSYADVLSNFLSIGGVVAGAVFLTPIGIAARPVIANPVGGTLAVVGVASVAGYGMWNVRQGQLTAAGYCGPFVANEKSSNGCSIVQGINYNWRDINTVCPQIQGNL